MANFRDIPIKACFQAKAGLRPRGFCFIQSYMNRVYFKAALLSATCLAAFFAGQSPAAEPWQAIAQYSKIILPTPESLALGEIKAEQIRLDDFPEGMNVESVYVLPLPPDRALAHIRMLRPTDDETEYPISNPAKPADFLNFAIHNASQWIWFDGGFSDASHLNLSLAERKWIADATSKTGANRDINEVWREVLLKRVLNFQKGGLMGCEVYQSERDSFGIGPEFAALLKRRGPLLNHFLPLLDGIMSGRDIANSLPPVNHWDDAKIEGRQTIELASIFAQSGDTPKAAEITYYVTSQYYASLILYELFPVQINGKTQTYIWRADYVLSAPSGFGKGIEKMAAENIMLIEIKKSIHELADECRRENGV